VAEAVAAMQEDATHYLAKPFNMDVLLELVERIQQQRQLEERLSAGRSSREEEDASPLIGTSPSLCHLPEELRGEDLPERASDRLLPLAEAVADFEREYLLRALRRCKWHKAQTAALMGVSRKTLWHKLKLYDIDGP
jgi:DNA-binding NtrC family response regulator